VVVKFVEPDMNLIKAIARDMRQADINEIWEARRQTPIKALIDGWDRSDFSAVVVVDDEPCVMLGLVVSDILSGMGVTWLLGTDTALKHKRQFVKLVPQVMNEMLNRCSKLYNWVHSENYESIRWLKRIGFTIEEPEKYGFNGAMFHKFHIERQDYV